MTNNLFYIKIKVFIVLLIVYGGGIMDEIKKLNKKRVAQNVGRLIAESEMSNEQIAYMLNITPRLLYYWQEGKRMPNTENVYGLSQLFKVSMESILA